MKNSSILTNYIYITLSGILFGMLIFGGGMMGKYGFSLLEVIIIPALMVVVMLFWFVRKEIKSFYSVPLWVSIFYFAFNVIGHFSQYAPLFLGVSVSLTLFLLYSQPLWTIIISTAFLKEKFTKQDAVVTAAIVLGLVFLLSPWEKMTYSVLGIIFGLIAGIEMSVWILFSSNYSKKDISPLTTTFFVNLYASLPFILAYPLIVMLFPNPEISALSFNKPPLVMFYVFIFAVVICIGARLLFCKAAQKVNNIHLGLILLLEPVVGTSLDVIFLGTPFTWNIAFGGLLILLANAGLIIKNSRGAE
ncbi:MAG: DMT family transporter [Lactobacillaceae bacterium]|nr:DMT family transporter [Lactobacillaceae bacterium]